MLKLVCLKGEYYCYKYKYLKKAYIYKKALKYTSCTVIGTPC